MRLISLLILVVTILPSCKLLRNPQTGEALGEKGGGMLGSIVGEAAGNAEVGNAIGTALGGATGEALLKSLEAQAREIREAAPLAKVSRAGDSITVEFANASLFENNRASLAQTAGSMLEPIVQTFTKYPGTSVTIKSFTDSRGTIKQNLVLSSRRAGAVANYLRSRGVKPEIIRSRGLGEAFPKYSNEEPEGRKANRRIEMVLTR